MIITPDYMYLIQRIGSRNRGLPLAGHSYRTNQGFVSLFVLQSRNGKAHSGGCGLEVFLVPSAVVLWGMTVQDQMWLYVSLSLPGQRMDKSHTAGPIKQGRTHCRVNDLFHHLAQEIHLAFCLRTQWYLYWKLR